MAQKDEKPQQVRRFDESHVVLAVDDNRDAVDSLSAILRANNLSVHVAYDGRQAIAVAETIRPRAIVLDIGMPGLSGYEVAQWVRSQPWGAAVRLIAVTGWARHLIAPMHSPRVRSPFGKAG